MGTLITSSLGAACSVSCFDFAYSIVARSGSFAMVGRQLAHNEEYLKAIKDHILGMIMTTRVQFMVPECLKKYVRAFASFLLLASFLLRKVASY